MGSLNIQGHARHCLGRSGNPILRDGEDKIVHALRKIGRDRDDRVTGIICRSKGTISHRRIMRGHIHQTQINRRAGGTNRSKFDPQRLGERRILRHKINHMLGGILLMPHLTRKGLVHNQIGKRSHHLDGLGRRKGAHSPRTILHFHGKIIGTIRHGQALRHTEERNRQCAGNRRREHGGIAHHPARERRGSESLMQEERILLPARRGREEDARIQRITGIGIHYIHIHHLQKIRPRRIGDRPIRPHPRIGREAR